jgi:hypothetical protein
MFPGDDDDDVEVVVLNAALWRRTLMTLIGFKTTTHTMLPAELARICFIKE